MSVFENVLGVLSQPGPGGRVALLGLAWTTAACIGNLFAAVRLLRHFSREGPVIPILLPHLERRWTEASFRLKVWAWLRRFGLFLLFFALLLAVVELGLFVRELLAEGPSGPGWREVLALRIDHVSGALSVFGIGILVRALFGGMASLVAVRAQNYVSSSSALVSPEEVQRMRGFLDRLDQTAAMERPEVDR
jgi:hypothetical protein